MKNIHEYIQVISLFDNENKFYWIKALPICEADKGFLLLYFNLL